MKRLVACLLLSGLPAHAAIPLPDTDLWAANLVIVEGKLTVERARRITDVKGYENQPAFVDETLIIYSAEASEGQTDVFALDVDSGERERLAATPESEFSPTPVPGGGLSAVRVAGDGTQQLWLLRDGAKDYELLFPLLEGIGYHAWLDANRVALFMIIPGKETAELHIAHRASGEVMIISRDVGRSLQPWPGEPGSLAFIEPGADGKRWIKRFDFAERKLTPLIPVLEGSLDFTTLPDGRLLMARGKELFASQGDKWQPLAKLDQLPGIITRLAVNATGTRLVMVADE